MPVLVLTPEGAAEDTVHRGSDAVLRWAAAQPGGAPLAPPPGAAEATHRRLLELHAVFDAEDAAFALGSLVTRAQYTTVRLRAVAARLAEVRDDEHAPAEAREAARARCEALQAREKRWSDDADGVAKRTLAAAEALLDALEEALTPVGSGPFACGVQYTTADAVCTVFLANAARHPALADALAKRPLARRYMRDCVSLRPSFVAADVWTRARAGKAPEVVATAMVGPLRALGAMLHDHVAVPIANTNAYKTAAIALIDARNDFSVPLEEEIKPAFAAGVKRYITEPAAAAGRSVHDNVIVPCGEAAQVVGAGLEVHVLAPVRTAASAAGTCIAETAQQLAESPPCRAASAAFAPVAEAGRSAAHAVGESCAKAGAAVEAHVTPIANGTFDAVLVRVA